MLTLSDIACPDPGSCLWNVVMRQAFTADLSKAFALSGNESALSCAENLVFVAKTECQILNMTNFIATGSSSRKLSQITPGPTRAASAVQGER